MGWYKKLTKEQQARVRDFAREAILLSDEINSALEHQIPMTQELFKQCASELIRINSSTGFHRLFDEFPEQAEEFERTMGHIEYDKFL